MTQPPFQSRPGFAPATPLRRARSTALRAVVFSALFALILPVKAQEPAYLDDRSTPQQLIKSYYNAINSKLFAQAYSYFQQDMAPTDFKSWMDGYSGTRLIEVAFGPAPPDAGAGQIRWNLPVALKSTATDGTVTVFSGSYTIHLISPGFQSDPPFQPMGIVNGDLRESREPFEKAVPGNC